VVAEAAAHEGRQAGSKAKGVANGREATPINNPPQSGAAVVTTPSGLLL